MYYYISYIVFQEMNAISHLLTYGLKTHTQTLALLANKLLFKYTIHCYTETVLPNLSKYSHMLKDGINIIYSKPFTSDYMEWFPAPLI